jgi:hypothetical protein
VNDNDYCNVLFSRVGTIIFFFIKPPPSPLSTIGFGRVNAPINAALPDGRTAFSIDSNECARFIPATGTRYRDDNDRSTVYAKNCVAMGSPLFGPELSRSYRIVLLRNENYPLKRDAIIYSAPMRTVYSDNFIVVMLMGEYLSPAIRIGKRGRTE